MTPTQEFFIRVLSDHLNGRPTQPHGEVDWQEMLRLSEAHQLGGIVYVQCSPFFPEEVTEAFAHAYGLATFSYYNRIDAMNQASAALKQENIPFFEVKGLTVAQLYPIPALRSMGDTDLVIPEECREQAVQTLVERGFQVDKIQSAYEWKKLHWGELSFELHDRLIYHEAVTRPRHEAFFNNCWQYVRDNRLDWSFHFLFLVLHLQKHFLNRGVGFRQFMDLAVTMRGCGELNWPWIRTQLEQLEMLRFTQTCLFLLHRWFGVTCPLTGEPLSEAFYQAASDAILANGVFGFDDEDNLERSILNPYAFQPGNPPLRRFRLVLQNLFPPYWMMRDVPYYRFVNHRPWLLPAAWVYRFFYGATHRKTDEVKRMARQVTASEEKLLRHRAWLEQWGLEGETLPQSLRERPF